MGIKSGNEALARAIAGPLPRYRNLSEAKLVEAAVQNGEARIAAGGAVAVETGTHTGRSPKDKFIVRDDATRNTVWWDANNAMSPAAFDRVLADFATHVAAREVYVTDLAIGTDAKHQVKVRVVTEFAWHALFARNLLVRLSDAELANFAPELTIVDMPSFKADPARHEVRTETVIACDFTKGIILIGGTRYAGEIKKAAFTYLNFVLPGHGILPMHCSANVGSESDAAVFFGLSGTGKTTLSADPRRTLIGDDEHGWGTDGVFNFEGGCYAKTINLSAEAEPQIHAATSMFGTVLENVVIHGESRRPDFEDASLTENGRAAYPIAAIPNASASGRTGHPRNVVFLTADAFGVMPPVARLTPAQAFYHFLSGYTARVAGTERGVTEPVATFSTCFGAPFMPRHPAEYGSLLAELIERHEADCWLVNTGWTGGPYGVGHRMPIAVTRRLLGAALDGSLRQARFSIDRTFGFAVPDEVPGVDAQILTPRRTWSDGAAFDRQAERLAGMFADNARRFAGRVPEGVLSAGLQLATA